jgi:zinc protease
MGQGTSSRLYRRLVYKEQWATSAGARNSSLQDSGLFQIFVTQKPGADFDRVQRAIYGEMWRPRNLLVSNTELEIARNQLLKGHVDSLKTLHGRAEAIATNEILFGDYTRTFSDLQRYMKITAADLKRVAAQYLTPERSSLVVIRSQAGGSIPAGRSSGNDGQGGGR